MGQETIIVFSALTGGAIGFISSYSMWKIQMNRNRRNVAQGFYLEISSLENAINQYAMLIETPDLKSKPVKIEQPIYSDGLFFDCRKEIFTFNANLSKKLFEFYTYLLEIERFRKIDESNRFFIPMNDGMKKSLKKANELLPKLKASLKKETLLFRLFGKKLEI